jgi:hypothetical protein
MHFLLRVAAPPWTRLWFLFHFGWLMDVLHPSIHQLKGHAQGAGGPNHYPLCRPLYVLSLKCLLEQGQAKLKWSILDKLVAAWMRVLLTFLISYVLWLLANSMNLSACCFWKCCRNSRCGFSYCILIYTHLL